MPTFPGKKLIYNKEYNLYLFDEENSLAILNPHSRNSTYAKKDGAVFKKFNGFVPGDVIQFKTAKTSKYIYGWMLLDHVHFFDYVSDVPTTLEVLKTKKMKYLSEVHNLPTKGIVNLPSIQMLSLLGHIDLPDIMKNHIPTVSSVISESDYKFVCRLNYDSFNFISINKEEFFTMVESNLDCGWVSWSNIEYTTKLLENGSKIRSIIFDKPNPVYWKYLLARQIIDQSRQNLKFGTTKELVQEITKILMDSSTPVFALPIFDLELSEREVTRSITDLKIWAAIYLLTGSCDEHKFRCMNLWIQILGETNRYIIYKNVDKLIEFLPNTFSWEEIEDAFELDGLGQKCLEQRPDKDRLKEYDGKPPVNNYISGPNRWFDFENTPEDDPLLKDSLFRGTANFKDFDDNKEEYIKKNLPRLYKKFGQKSL